MVNWNKEFTALIRENQAAYWGNWGLDSRIRAGAVGIVNPSTGEFKLVRDQLPGVSLSENEVSKKWEMRSSKVKKTVVRPKVSGSFTDPQTGTTLNIDSDIEWKFESTGSMASEFAVVKEVSIMDLTHLNKEFKWLAQQASQVAYGSDGRISQGFGVITSVIYASSGLNVGAKDKNASFVISGNADALNTLLGSGSPKASISGSFTSTKEQKSLVKHIWPETAITASSTPIPIAYTFTSFEGDMIIPEWVDKFGSFVLEVDSLFGSTYTASLTLEYDTPEKPNQTVPGFVIAGQSDTFGNIPLTATNIKLEVNFKDLKNGTTLGDGWKTPLGQWTGGKCRVELSGVWPGVPKMKVV